MVHCRFEVEGVSISKHQFLICPLFSCSSCTHSQLLPWQPEKICSRSWPTLAHHSALPSVSPALCQLEMSVYCWLYKCRRWSVVRGNRLDVFWGPLGDCRDLWEDDLISNFLLSCLGCGLVTASNTEAREKSVTKTMLHQTYLEYGFSVSVNLDVWLMDTGVAVILHW